MSNPRIMVFDSGVGGLSILQAIQQAIPGCNLIYACDNAAFPYGIRAEAELIDRVDRVLHRFLELAPADLIVIACNTASTLTLPHIRSHFSQPVVGVVPAIKPAAAQSRSKVIGLLATPATVNRPYTSDLIAQFASDCRVIAVGSRELVELAEAKLRHQPVDAAVIDAVAKQFTGHPEGANMDTLVLACTHFPLLREELAAALPAQVAMIDSADAIARRVAYWLDHLHMKTGAQPEQHRSLFTRRDQDLMNLQPALRALGLATLDCVDI